VKLGVIMDGISRDMKQALKVMEKEDIRYTQLQYVWDKEIGDHSTMDLKEMKTLLEAYGVQVTCISKHNFSGLGVLSTKTCDLVYHNEIEKLKRSIEAAQLLGTKHVRMMGCGKQVFIWGENGADQWLARGNSAWDKLLELYALPVRMAEENDIYLLNETGNNSMITSGYLHKKLIEDLGSDRMKTMWDPANSITGGDIPFPTGYHNIKEHLADVHIKDMVIDREKATVKFVELGTGDMKPYLADIAAALKAQYDGVVTLENVYQPFGKDFVDGFYLNWPTFRRFFEH